MRYPSLPHYWQQHFKKCYDYSNAESVMKVGAAAVVADPQ
jgi:hypothetical protein